MTVPRKSPCPCGSGKKYKNCCCAKDARVLRPKPQKAHEELDAAFEAILDVMFVCPDCKAPGREQVPCDVADEKGVAFGVDVHTLPRSWQPFDPHTHLFCAACGSIGTAVPPRVVGCAFQVPEMTWDSPVPYEETGPFSKSEITAAIEEEIGEDGAK